MYGKIFAQIFDGSLNGHLEASAVFMAMIAIAEIDGTVDLTLTALVNRTGWPHEFIEKGVQELEQLDPDSRTPDEDGRRLVRLRDNTQWGWRITNYQKYREIRDAEGRREYMRRYMQDRRGKQPVNSVNSVNSCKPALAHAEVDAEAEADKKQEPLIPAAPGRRASGTNPRALGTNPRALGINPRSVDQSPIEGLDLKAWELWGGYKHYSSKYAPIAQRHMARLGSRQMEAVEYSIANKYTGLYLPKGNGKARSEWE